MDAQARVSAALAARLATNTGATSYHLRQLAEVGLIVDVPDRGRGRERWWAAAHEVTSWSDADFDEDPDDRAAANWLMGHHTRTTRRWIEDWLESRNGWSPAWRRAASLGDMRLQVTPQQAVALEAELYEVIARYHAAGPDEGEAADLMILLDLFPVRDLPL